MALLKIPWPHLSLRQWIAIGKGVFAYTLSFVLIFLHDFNRLLSYPIVLTSLVLVSIAGQPGLSVGACLDGGALGIAGVGVGAVFYVILAKLGSSPVAQGFVFWIMLYGFALVKAQSMRYFAFSLLGIIVSFSGIYTSVLLGGVFEPKYLQSYLIAYCFGFAIVLGTNWFILPISSERQLRELLVSSLQRVATLSHLIAKTYVLDISDEEKEVRDLLNQSIRQDFAFLSQKLNETSLEVNWTRWSVTDYSKMVHSLRQMQQGMITAYSSLISMERYDPEALAVIKRQLVETGTGKAFARLRRGTDLAIADLVKELAVGEQEYLSPAGPGQHSWDDFRDVAEDGDLEKGAARARAPSVSPTNAEAVRARLLQVSSRLRREVEGAGMTPVGSRRNSIDGSDTEKPSLAQNVPSSAPSSAATPRFPSLVPKSGRPVDRVAFLRQSWTSFEDQQNDAISTMLGEGIAGDDELQLHQAGPSLHETYSKPLPKGPWRARTTAVRPSATEPAKRTAASAMPSDGAASDTPDSLLDKRSDEPCPSDQICGTAVMRVFSFLFGMGQVVTELAELHTRIVPKEAGEADGDLWKRSKSLHFHLFEKIAPSSAKKDKNAMSLQAALHSLNGKEYVTPKVSFLVRIAQLERLARSDTSIYAFKTACAVSVFTVFILAPSLKTFFVSYGLTGGLITIVVAMAPTLGQTVVTFILQILGTGFGAIYGMVVLYIFKGVGGFVFNPYGLVAALALFAVPMCWIIYVKPMFFAGALLAMNGAGILIVTEWIYNEVPGQIRPGFDSAGLRAAKALVAMSLALGVAGIFQIFILRTPARQTLRVKLSEVTFSLSSYNALFSELTQAIVPIVPDASRPAPDRVAIEVVRQELIAREGKIQGQILALMPLLRFGAAEPSFGTPFQAACYARIIRTHQLVLDRLREARTAVGVEGFSPAIQEQFTTRLSPYRRQTRRFSRALFYLCATSLATKTPLPHELPSMVTTARAIQHDALILSGRLTRTEEGRATLRSQSFLHYWFYLCAFSSTSYLLESMEDDLRILFGELDENPFSHS